MAEETMQEFMLYTSTDDRTLYRYLIRQRGPVFYITMSRMENDVEAEQLGTRVVSNITRQDAIEECLAHCRRRSHTEVWRRRKALLAGVRNWLVCSVAMLTFIRLAIVKS